MQLGEHKERQGVYKKFHCISNSIPNIIYKSGVKVSYCNHIPKYLIKNETNQQVKLNENSTCTDMNSPRYTLFHKNNFIRTPASN